MEEKARKNADPITGKSGAHPIGTGVGAVGGGVAGAAMGAAIGGPIGAAVGTVVGGGVWCTWSGRSYEPNN